MEKIRVLIADDSAIIRGLLEKAFKASDFEIVDLVSNGRKALDSAQEKKPDLVITDFDMPELNGIEATKIIHGKLHIPVVMFSENMEARDGAMKSGVLLFEQKPALSAFKMDALKTFVDKVKAAYKTLKPKKSVEGNAETIQTFNSFKIVVLGASTGGPTAVQTVLSSLKENFPLPILYVQHIDVGADSKMAAWFSESCPNIHFKLAENGEEAKAGTVYMAQADKHLLIDFVNANGNPVLKLSDEPPERFLRPAVNKLFKSAAVHYKNACLAVLMTGMGRDGAEGCKAVIDAGGMTICEDKSTCTVFGMPAAAIELNAATEILPRHDIAERLLNLTKEKGGINL